ncbi:unnamed protein product, partial [Mesorhabditis spiculigera]
MEQVHKPVVPTISAAVSETSLDWETKKERPRSLRSVTFSSATVIRITRDTVDDDPKKSYLEAVEPPRRTNCYAKIAGLIFLNLVAASLILVFVLSKKH